MKNRKKNYPWLFFVLLGILIASIAVIILLLLTPQSQPVVQVDDNITNESASESSAETEVKPEKIDFQPIVDEWVATTSGSKGVLIYDLDRDEVAAEYNADELFSTASVYKLFVVYESYKRIESGEWDGEEPAGVTGYSILECLDLAIRESNSACAETLWDMIGRDELETIIQNDWGITDSDISSFVATSRDVAKMMNRFYTHPDFNDPELIAQMKDSFLNQPKTIYDWRQGLPSGFSDNAKVYNKVGWDYNAGGYWNIYNDVAIVEFPEQDRHFIVVVMTNRVLFQKIRELGAMIEQAVLVSTEEL